MKKVDSPSPQMAFNQVKPIITGTTSLSSPTFAIVWNTPGLLS